MGLPFEWTKKWGASHKNDDFEVLAVCLFNQTGSWNFLFADSKKLEVRPEHPDYLVIMQKVPYGATEVWKGTLREVVDELIGGC